MLRSFYTAATAMMTQNRRMDIVTNNLSNVETRGYKSDNLVSRSFQDVLLSRINDPYITQAAPIGTINRGIHIDQVYTTFVQGSLENTGVPTDLAQTQDAFFVILTPDGERYTRSGNFNVDAAGYLVTQTGAYVAGQNGPIPVGMQDFTVTDEGVVQIDGATVDQLRCVSFADNQGLRKERDGLFYNYDAATNPEQAVMPAVKQGYLENSNVDTGKEMVNMMEIYRSYELNQRVLRMLDESLGKTVNEIARV